jgi:hypothetical protein
MKRRILSTQERRWVRLKRELSRGFRRGTDLLLDHAWLCRNDVTLTECGRLADWISDCLAANLDMNALLRDMQLPTPPGSETK